MKKPTLTVVDQPKPNSLAPPPGLGEAGAKLWQAIHRDYVIDDAGGHQMLLRICEAADSLAVMDSEIERDGATFECIHPSRAADFRESRLLASIRGGFKMASRAD